MNARSFGKVDVDSSSWLQTVKEVQKDAKKASKPDPSAFKKLASKIKELNKDINANAIMIQNAKNDPQRAKWIPVLQRSIDQLREKKKAIVDSPAHGVNKAMLMLGAKIVAENTKAHLTDRIKLPRGKAKHLFIQSISVHGALCCVEHSGLQLSNSDCIDALKIIEEITAFTSAAYAMPARVESVQA
jgi:hypothetical protein